MRRISGASYDDQLVIAARAGDNIAYGRLVKLYQSPIRGFLRQLTRQDFALADDLAQDTFIHGFKKLDSFRAEASLKSWLTSIAYSLFLQHIRKDKRRAALIDTTAYDDSSYDTQLDNRIDIEKALMSLCLDQRTAISLAHREGMSHSEVAKVMKIPIGTVKSHIARGRDKLKAILSQTSVRR